MREFIFKEKGLLKYPKIYIPFENNPLYGKQTCRNIFKVEYGFKKGKKQERSPILTDMYSF